MSEKDREPDKATQSDEERRRAARVVKVNLVQANSFLIGTTLNISRTGARIELYEPLAPGQTVVLDLALGDSVLDVEARVVYVNKDTEGRFSIGVHFHELDERQVKLLTDYLGVAENK